MARGSKRSPTAFRRVTFTSHLPPSIQVSSRLPSFVTPQRNGQVSVASCSSTAPGVRSTRSRTIRSAMSTSTSLRPHLHSQEVIHGPVPASTRRHSQPDQALQTPTDPPRTTTTRTVHAPGGTGRVRQSRPKPSPLAAARAACAAVPVRRRCSHNRAFTFDILR